MAQTEFRSFLAQLPGPKGVHLCGNPDWTFLLNAGLDILSVDAFSWGQIFIRYIDEVKEFLNKGGIITWGITPTLTDELNPETLDTLTKRLLDFWEFLGKRGISETLLYDQAWLAPSRCCLINTDGTASIKRSFDLLQALADRLHLYFRK